jgi:hypothetical protein
MNMFFLAAIILLACAVLAMEAAQWFDVRYRFSESWTIASVSLAVIFTVFAVIALCGGGLAAMGWLT